MPLTNGVPGILKLSFPTFDGAEDPSGWLNRCDQFFHLQQTMDRDRVWLAFFHLTGVAQQWYYRVDQDAGDVGAFTWDIFKVLCLQRFAPALSPHRPDELARWPCHATVDEVQEVVPTRLASASQHSPHQQAHLPTSGLSDHVRVDVELPELEDPQGAMSLARDLERHGQAVRPPSEQGVRTNKPAVRSLPPTVTPPSSAQPPMAISPALPPPPRPFRCLSSAELAERRRQGLCYSCDEQYSPDHKCQRLFYLEVTDPDR